MTSRPTTGPELLVELDALLGDRLSQSPYDIDSHAVDEGRQPAAPPDAVAFPETNEEVAAIVRACAARSTPVVAFGAGTSLEGQVQAIHGGISVDLSRMNKLIEVNVDDLDCRVQAGITRNQLNAELEKSGLQFPIDPGADASIGGMTATGASGTTAVRYGTMRENIIGLTVVLADGRVIRTGGRARKSSAGYDLTRLFVGSEGTLGVITEIQLRLQPLPETMAAAVCPFETLEGAVDTVVEVLQAGIPVARCELMDEASVRAVNAYSKTDYPLKPTVFFEFHGGPKSAAEQAEVTGTIAKDADQPADAALTIILPMNSSKQWDPGGCFRWWPAGERKPCGFRSQKMSQNMCSVEGGGSRAVPGRCRGCAGDVPSRCRSGAGPEGDGNFARSGVTGHGDLIPSNSI